MPERLGILGGTFDPIHRGHIETAETVKACLGLDRVLLTPSHVPPHRSAAPRASSFDRFAMTALAAAAHPGLVASAIELVREGPSYTADTLDLLHAAGHAASQLFFITGADAFAEIATWRRYPALLDACHFVAVARPGFSLAELRLRLPSLRDRLRVVDGTAPRDETPGAIYLVDMPTPDVSSTDIRERLARGHSCDDVLAPFVADYIASHGLYRPATDGAAVLPGATLA
ncbi:MAG: nicotinate-nucleotide adenylyltransferase [Vicinamibacterales bacterium]